MSSRAMKFFKGCAIGCGVMLLLATVSCIGFVVWLRQPGELLEAERLVGSDTTGYAGWTLSLDDPGTRALVEEMLEVIWRVREGTETPLPAVLDSWLKGMQQASDERKIRELFPLAVAWSMRPGGPEGTDLHALTVSVEKLGNRGVLADWILAWALSRADEADVIVHQGERIYRFETGTAFFLRHSDVVLTSDLETARMVVERIQRDRVEKDASGEIDALLGSLPTDIALRCALSNRHGELERVAELVSAPNVLRGLRGWDWGSAEGLTLGGGFTDESAFHATLTVIARAGTWAPGEGDRLADLLGEALGGEEAGVHVWGRVGGQRLIVDLSVDDLPGRVELLLEQAQRLAVEAPPAPPPAE